LRIRLYNQPCFFNKCILSKSSLLNVNKIIFREILMAVKSWQVISSIVLITSITVLMQIPSETWITSATVSLIMGASALACMASSCILASRWHGVERIFGGLDRVYEAHKWIAI